MITPPWFDTPVETLAFNAYAMHTSELDELIQYFRMHPVFFLTDEKVAAASKELGLSISHLSNDEYDYVMKGISC